jgi:hypothetical protein
MATTELAQLQACETADPVLSRVADRIREVVPALAAARGLQDVGLFVTDFTRADEPLRASSYYTDGVKALFHPPVIVIDAAFMLELEAAFRSFDLSESLLESQYLRSDEDLFGLVKRIRLDPQDYLARLRRVTVPKLKRDGSYVVEMLTLVLLFFVSHELGHLVSDRGERSYTTFLRPDAQLEGRIANAVLKLCRHADEFAKYKFDLPGFQAVVQPGSEVRAEVRKLAEQVDDALEVNHAKYFGDEIAADEVATAILIAHLEKTGGDDALAAHQHRYLLCEGLFVAALYTWYRDLLAFGEKLGLGQGANSRALVVEMMKERGSYIKAGPATQDGAALHDDLRVHRRRCRPPARFRMTTP